MRYAVLVQKPALHRGEPGGGERNAVRRVSAEARAPPGRARWGRTLASIYRAPRALETAQTDSVLTSSRSPLLLPECLRTARQPSLGTYAFHLVHHLVNHLCIHADIAVLDHEGPGVDEERHHRQQAVNLPGPLAELTAGSRRRGGDRN